MRSGQRRVALHVGLLTLNVVGIILWVVTHGGTPFPQLIQKSRKGEILER